VKKQHVFTLLALVLALGITFPGCMTKGPADTLSGDNEVPAVTTDAEGKANFTLNSAGDVLSYTLNATDIDNVMQAHIHLASAGKNGPVVAWLYPSAPPAVLISGTHNGLLAEGEIVASELMGPLAGMTISDLMDAIEAGNAYVNIHTSAYPAGEIRGQIRASAATLTRLANRPADDLPV